MELKKLALCRPSQPYLLLSFVGRREMAYHASSDFISGCNWLAFLNIYCRGVNHGPDPVCRAISSCPWCCFQDRVTHRQHAEHAGWLCVLDRPHATPGSCCMQQPFWNHVAQPCHCNGSGAKLHIPTAVVLLEYGADL